MNAKDTITKLRSLLRAYDKFSPEDQLFNDSQISAVSSAISLLESMGKDGELLEFIRRKSKVVKADSTRTLLQIELPVAPSFREAITTAMKKEA